MFVRAFEAQIQASDSVQRRASADVGCGLARGGVSHADFWHDSSHADFWHDSHASFS